MVKDTFSLFCTCHTDRVPVILIVSTSNSWVNSSYPGNSKMTRVATLITPLWPLTWTPANHALSLGWKESSSLFHHSIYLWFICFPWWSIDELENLHADRTTVCFEAWQKPRARLGSRKTGLSSPPPTQYFNTDRSKAVLLLWFLTVTCSCCPYLYFGSPIMLVTYFNKF